MNIGKHGRRLCRIGVMMAALLPRAADAAVDYVVHISIDGLRPDAITAQTAAALPNFYRLRSQGAFTDNARTDVDYTSTLQNHTGMLTGRPVLGPAGHNYVQNDVPPDGQTIHTVKGSYVTSVFDVVHDHGLSTGLYATKEKFKLYDTSYGPDASPLMGGAPDTTGVDNGRDKIDDYDFYPDSATVVGDWTRVMTSGAAYRYSFLHLHDPDAAGHEFTWDVEHPDSAYMASVRDVDTRLGEILNTIDHTPALAGHTALILSADHGGTQGTLDHSDAAEAQDYTIPFYVWGAGVEAGDLYAINAATRLDPGTGRPTLDDAFQPIRNGDSGNLALSLLGLGPVPGSTFNVAQDLAVPEPIFLTPAALLLAAGFGRRRVRRI